MRVFFFCKMNIHLLKCAHAVVACDAYELYTAIPLPFGIHFLLYFLHLSFHFIMFHDHISVNLLLFYVLIFLYVALELGRFTPTHFNPVCTNIIQWNDVEMNWAKWKKYFQLKIQSTKVKSPYRNARFVNSWTSLVTIIIRCFNLQIFGWI